MSKQVSEALLKMINEMSDIESNISKIDGAIFVRENERIIKEKQAKYFTAYGGIAALLSEKVKKCEIIAFEDLGTEAIYKLEVEKFPLIVEI